MQTWRLDCPAFTLLLASPEGGVPEAIYWGPPLPAGEDADDLVAASRMDIARGMLDRLPPLSLCPEARNSFPGIPGFEIEGPEGPAYPKLELRDVEATNDRLRFDCSDPTGGFVWRAELTIHPEADMLEMTAEFAVPDDHRILWLSAPILPASQAAVETIDFGGRWCGEFQSQRLPWKQGARLRDNPTGRSDHAHFPALLTHEAGTSNTSGHVQAWHYGFSGGHRMIAEELPDGRRQIQFGHRRSARTAPLYATFSTEGFNGVADAFHRHARRIIVSFPDPKRPRPVHYNCWEAVYFRHSLDELKEIAGLAADIGAERFVLDDGWFKGRDNDRTSLGDWEVDRAKWPGGLTPLIDHVASLDMSFGLWMEPEMVSRDSDLYRTHPDWVLGPDDQIPGRCQYVLDIARPDVRDHLFTRISALLAENAIDYVKWDHNRILPLPDTRQAEGIYALLDRLRDAHPDVEFESCASGGGRIDFGILSRTHRVWLSDSNDALERLRIQHEAALFLPPEITGSHVGPRQCHTSGRVLPMGFRAWVAAQRHLGFEMDPRELTDAERATLKKVTGWWKDNRRWTMSGRLHRLDSADPAMTAEMTIADDGGRFVLFAGQSTTTTQSLPRPLRLTGLEPDRSYALRLVNPEDIPAMGRGPNALREGRTVRASGAFLMNHGVSLPVGFPATMFVIEGEAA
ncbi:alpha-galactosidase [Inquilinus sp. CAU 1745]|uniref:alpha-galactosidase n=1 Tax=Inquilinus sp. CAU 1745 TaxID=3140369 RepID=UPI00325A553D